MWKSTYGQTLLLKLALLSMVVFTGAYNWLCVKPTLGTDKSIVRIRRTAGLELTLGAVVIVLTAVLVATPTPTDTRAMVPMSAVTEP